MGAMGMIGSADALPLDVDQPSMAATIRFNSLAERVAVVLRWMGCSIVLP
jgi:hypothetical protein